MISNFWIDNLNNLTEKDLYLFLQMDANITERPPEGIKLEYKSEWDKDLGKIVTSFANTEGGLIFLGIKENNSFPEEIIGVDWPGDRKLKAQQHIRSTVHPVPKVDIYEVKISKNNRSVIIIRVEAGPEYPYVYTHNGKEEIVYVRRGSQSIGATREELIALVNRYEIEQSLIKNVSIPSDFHFFGENKGAFIAYCPIFSKEAIMDSKLENSILNLINISYYNKYGKILRTERGMTCFEVELSQLVSPSTKELWRFYNDGKVLYGRNLEDTKIGEPGYFSAPDTIYLLTRAVKVGTEINKILLQNNARVAVRIRINVGKLKIFSGGAIYENLQLDLPINRLKDLNPQREFVDVIDYFSVNSHDGEIIDKLASLWNKIFRAAYNLPCDISIIKNFIKGHCF